jgi:NAD(P)-dependent dehydrogenase (short-subunit alcohol dehydrogenase family)
MEIFMKKICVVTGSSSGIGAASALRFAKEGWNVAINYSRDPAKAQASADLCRAAGAEVLVQKADVADDAACRSFAAAVKERFGACDALVNNAGSTKFVELSDLDGLDAADFQRIYAVNVIGAFQMVRAFAPLMKGRVGAGIVNVSSIASVMGAGSSIAYVASKGALNALSLSLARTLGPDIRVNVVAPGMVDGAWLREGLGAERFETFRRGYSARAALNDIVTPEHVAESIYFLCAVAKMTTGEVHLVDAGARAGAL